MSYILWLTSWYPSRVQPTNGDFVERHALAVSRSHNLVVLHIEKDERLAPGTSECEISSSENCKVYRVYYGKNKWGRFFEKLVSFYTYKKLQRKYYQEILQQYGPPQLIHVHESMKAGLLAMELQSTQHIPYLLTMHWTGYQLTFPPNYGEKGWYWNQVNRRILRNAKMITVVSDELGRALEAYAGKCPMKRVHNVVNTEMFYPAPEPPAKFRFIHASYLNYQKNPVGIIHAAAALQKEGYSFELVLVGREDPSLFELAQRLGMDTENIQIPGAKSHEQMPEALRSSSALLMFSRFENMPCIILEALCSGLPVISTAVGGIAEIIDESNGLLIENEEEEALKQAMKKMMEEYNNYDRIAIAGRAAKAFSRETVEKEFDTLYKQSGAISRYIKQ